LRVIFLGVAGSSPYMNHSLPSILIDDTLLDCGEGSLQALDKLGLTGRIKRILLTHVHADHVNGLLSLLWRYALEGRQESLTIIGPRGLKEFLDISLKITYSPIEKVSRYLKVKEITPPTEVEGIKVVQAAHPVISLAYRVGDVCYTGDTAPSEDIITLAEGCELLIHDSTFPPGMEEKAIQEGHSTPRQAALVAKRAKVDKLALFHLPFYFFKGDNFKKDYINAAKEIFYKVFIPSEFDEIEV